MRCSPGGKAPPAHTLGAQMCPHLLCTTLRPREACLTRTLRLPANQGDSLLDAPTFQI